MGVKVQPTQTRSGSGPSDAALVLAARAGEHWAQEALFRRYSRMVNGMAYRLMGRDQDVDDLVQESFIQALKSLDRLDNPQAFKSWLGSIVVRTAHKTLRHRSMLARLKIRPAPTADLDQLAAKASSPEVAAELRAVYGCLSGLSAQARMALLLHRVEGMSIPEVAASLGVSESTVKRRLAAAEAELAHHREKEEP
ncbi:MAG: sigma-70 family RNA polymerase sigma factor [Myxococcales bacterium]|nr:sigma-70 family RNA polymerase sigma factor [Myxococcales bacterium]MDD9965312.1 sigma-70 family RNA polymerase sigma factor [Myxococcales bacterium]